MSDEEEKMKSGIISISLTKALLDKVSQLQEERGFSSRSEVTRHALQTYTGDLERGYDDTTMGVFIIALSYYSVKTKPMDIQEIVKDFSNSISITSRTKISDSVNLVVFVLKTNINMARIFFEKLSSIRGLVDKKLFSVKAAI